MDSPQPESPDLDTILQAEIAREQASGQSEYTMPVERKTKRQLKTAQHSTPAASGSSSAWTPANQPSIETQGALPNVSKSRDAAPAAVPPRWAAIKEPMPLTSGSLTLQDHGTIGPSGMPLIDSFPKSKQRHIFGVIGGLESGIDHLNAQVVSLKALLGIDAEESKSR